MPILSFKKGLIEKCVFILKNRLIAIFLSVVIECEFQGKNYISDIEAACEGVLCASVVDGLELRVTCDACQG